MAFFCHRLLTSQNCFNEVKQLCCAKRGNYDIGRKMKTPFAPPVQNLSQLGAKDENAVRSPGAKSEPVRGFQFSSTAFLLFKICLLFVGLMGTFCSWCLLCQVSSRIGEGCLFATCCQGSLLGLRVKLRMQQNIQVKLLYLFPRGKR